MPPLDPTAAAGAARLNAFIPCMGRSYARLRNTDFGPGGHDHVSMLSPYLRRRLVLEPEAVRAALGAHGHRGAEKFVQEVIWRGYFKGWLEQRPQIWSAYRDGVRSDLDHTQQDAALWQRLQQAETGETGLACFDAWARELVETGYLHNHARMWFASIWIFTLNLPWRLGADFFYRHLLDGDPASNTLGWRWVAGLHTRGKAYQATAGNIAKCTDGRFAPRAGDLAATIQPLDHLEPGGLPEPRPLPQPGAPDPQRPTALLLTEEDGRMEDFPLDRFDLRAVATLSASHLRSPRGVARAVAEFEAGALADSAHRLGAGPARLRADATDALVQWAAASGARQIVTGYAPAGPLRDWLDGAAPALGREGIALATWRRDWDSLIWPHATAGFFKVKKKIPAILQQAGIG